MLRITHCPFCGSPFKKDWPSGHQSFECCGFLFGEDWFRFRLGDKPFPPIHEKAGPDFVLIAIAQVA